MGLEWNYFDQIREVLALQGFNVLPLIQGQKGTRGTFKWGHLNGPQGRRATPADREMWERRLTALDAQGRVGSYLLPSSGQGWCYVIVDVDNEDYDEQCIEQFGPSPLYVSRNGRVRHRYYRSHKAVRTWTQVWGPGTVDIVGTTGVVLPHSIHSDGEEYALSIPLDQWTEEWVKENVPEFPDISSLRSELQKSPTVDLQAVCVEGQAEGFIHTSNPVVRSSSVWCGWIQPGTIIKGPDLPIAELPNHTRCFATYRDDSRPSAEVTDHNRRRSFWDWSTTPPRYWTMLEPLDGVEDPVLPDKGNYHARLEHDLTSRLGIDTTILADTGYIDAQIPELEDNSTTFVIAPHGSGKTIMAKREHARALTSVSVCNTQALTIANAAVLGLKAVYEGVDTVPKGSCCIPSLPRYTEPPEFFHVDEANEVHGFLHSGKVDEPVECWRSLVYFASASRRSLIASADLSFEDVALFTQAIRARNPTRRIRCYIRVPTRVRATIVLTSVAAAKSEFHTHASRRHTHPTFVGITTRKLAGSIAQGYRIAGASESIDMDEVATLTSVLDSPRPYPLAAAAADRPVDTAVRAPFYVSGENNRYYESIRWLEDTDSIVNTHDLIVTSPAVQSGVSFNPTICRVFIFHENKDVPADSVLQIARRARNIEDTDIIVGVRRWSATEFRTDRPYLDDIARKRTKTTVKVIARHFPEFEEDHGTPVDEEFAWSWRITARKYLKSRGDPIGELRKSAARHGYSVEDMLDYEPESDDPGKCFNAIVRAAGDLRREINATETAKAPEIDPDEAKRLEAAAKLQDGERQKLDKSAIGEFYGCAVTPDLVTLDNGGKYRAQVRSYSHVALLSHGCEDAVAYLDHARSKGRQPSEMPHLYAKAAIMLDLIRETGCAVGYDVHAIRPLVKKWWVKNRARAQTFFPRLKGPAPDYETRWLGDRLRALGARLVTSGLATARTIAVSWDVVDEHASAYGERILEHEQNSGPEQWRKQWKNHLKSAGH